MNYKCNQEQLQWSKEMESLKSMHSGIANLIGSGKVAFLDCPIYFNFGDLLIWHGTEAFFKKYDIRVVYRSEASHVDYKKLKECDVIVFQGGGNFGDLYPRVQRMREDIIKKFKNKKIICLPQTIHFSNTSAMKQSAHEISKHNDFHFFVRDKKSESIASTFTDKYKLMPDMAHSLHPLVAPFEVGLSEVHPQSLLIQQRDDAEKGNLDLSTVNKRTFDWNDLVRIEDRFVKKVILSLSKAKINQNKIIALWQLKSFELEQRAIELFESKDLIITDRLHGMILASLLGKKCHVYDNSYGKNSGYYDCWLSSIPNVNMIKVEKF